MTAATSTPVLEAIPAATDQSRWGRAVSVLVVLLALMAAWESYKVVATALGTIVPVRPDNVTMPHMWDIFAEYFEPATRGGAPLILVLLQASLVTLGEALVGFVIGGVFGFGLGVLFVRSTLAERAFMPYAVASQTVPIIAIAPMVVIWGRGIGWPPWVSVSLIASYLTFFPVAVNTLRGLRSPAATATELMRSYAASPNEVLWKLQVPSAMPYIFTALKISATASVIGALIGELPGSVGGGLGRVLLDYSQRFAVVSPKLYATVFVTCFVGIVFVGAVTAVEHRVVHAANRQRE